MNDNQRKVIIGGLLHDMAKYYIEVTMAEIIARVDMIF